MTGAQISVCPGCGTVSSEDYDGQGSCYACHVARIAQPATPAIRFLSAAELKAATPPEPDWLIGQLVAMGNVTILGGRPKAGKSTLAFAAASACATAATRFLGQPLLPSPVVYVSEESAGTLVHKMPDSERLRILTRENAWPKPPWPELVAAAVAEAKRVGALLLIVDTLPHWAALPPEREKDSGAALQTMERLLEAAAGGLGVLALAHTRKGGGEEGEGLRGSSAFAGACDIILELDRVPEAPRQRVVLSLSRYPQTPGTLVVEMDDTGEWRVVSSDEERSDAQTIAKRNRAASDRQALTDALGQGDPLTRAELEESLGVPSRQWHSILDEAVKAGQVSRIGAGKRGDPYRYEILRTVSAQVSAQGCAETEARVIPFSAAPRRGAEKESNVAASLNGARCAETAESAIDDGALA
jgi:hypothetical protein